MDLPNGYSRNLSMGDPTEGFGHYPIDDNSSVKGLNENNGENSSIFDTDDDSINISHSVYEDEEDDMKSQESLEESNNESDSAIGFFIDQFDMNDDSENNEKDDYEAKEWEELNERNRHPVLLAYASFVVSEQMSEKTLIRMENLMTLLCNCQPMFTHNDVKNMLEWIHKKTVRAKKYYCNSCGYTKNKKQEKCTKCANDHNSNSMSTITMLEMDAVWQLKNVLKHFGTDIINAHQMIHQKKEQFKWQDSRRFAAYQKKMESLDEFNDGFINVIITCSSDGAIYKRLSRRECTPVLVRVEGLEEMQKTGGRNMILLSQVFASGGVKQNFMDTFVRRSYDQFSHCSIQMELMDRVYTFRVKPLVFVSDLKEQRSLSQLPNWQNEMGCSICLVKGEKKSSSCYSYPNPEPHTKRTNHSMLLDSKFKMNGYTSGEIPTLYSYFEPVDIIPDPFHIVSLGVCKRIVNELNNPDGWRKAKLKRGVHAALSTSISSITPYTFQSVALLPWEKKSIATGKETEKMSIYLSALVGVTNGCKNSDFSVFCFSLFFCLHHLGENDVDTSTLQSLMALSHKLIGILEPKTVPIKLHLFFQHCTEIVSKFGPTINCEAFEREHHNMMVSVHYGTTNCESMLVSRYVARQFIQEHLRSSLSRLPTHEKQLVIDSQKPLRCEKYVKNVDIPTRNEIQFHQLELHHQRLVDSFSNLMGSEIDSRKTFLTQVPYSSRKGNFVVGCRTYLRQSRSSHGTVCWISSNTGFMKIGEVEIIWISPKGIQLIIRESVLEPMATTLRKHYENAPLLSVSKEILQKTAEFPLSIGRVLKEEWVIAHLNEIYCPASVVFFQSQKFVLNMH